MADRTRDEEFLHYLAKTTMDRLRDTKRDRDMLADALRRALDALAIQEDVTGLIPDVLRERKLLEEFLARRDRERFSERRPVEAVDG